MVNFHASSRKSENLHFHGLLLSKAYKHSDESREDLPVSWHWRLMQSFTKNWLLAPKMTVRNLVNFIASSDKSGNLHFYVVLLLSIAYKVLAKKVQKNYLSSHWKKIQTLKKNWLFFLKNDMRNLVNFNLSIEKSENLHFVDGVHENVV